MKRLLRRAGWGTGLLMLALSIPVGINAALYSVPKTKWYEASRESSGLAPKPAAEPRAVVQVYAAHTFGWRGAVAVHTWIVTKKAGADRYERADVMGWGRGRTVRLNHDGPDAFWYGNPPELLVDLRGEAAAALIPAIEEAIRDYPYPETYRSWPGPNSNTFIAWIGRRVPGLGLNMPPHAIGKDYLPWDRPVATAPSGRGLQVSLGGFAGFLISPVEGVEVNVLGLALGVGLAPLSLRLPAVGTVELFSS